MKGNLTFVATPIGNLDDMSFRAINTLKECDIILCEDTRRSLKLLNYFDIKKTLMSFHKFNYKEATKQVISKLLEGKNLCLITDAGTPCISDPGSELIEQLKANEITYSIVPGACAFVNAFALSGFSAPFTFVGFIPDNKKEKKSLLEDIKQMNTTLIFYSAPHSLQDDISLLYNTLGNRKVCAVRELTKLHEEIIDFYLEDGYPKEPKGEFVIVVEAKEKEQLQEVDVLTRYSDLISAGFSKNDAIKQIAKEKKVAKNIIYQEVLNLK